MDGYCTAAGVRERLTVEKQKVLYLQTDENMRKYQKVKQTLWCYSGDNDGGDRYPFL